jgi:predicted GH43/DUF377 family glycosyl hydrolase
MTYTAYGPLGPRIALALSEDLFTWTRLGLAKFALERGVEFDFYTNKDALIFPQLVPDPEGRPSIGMIHRPTYDVKPWGGPAYQVMPDGICEERPSMWISYYPVDPLRPRLGPGVQFGNHQLLASPIEPWEALKIGGGTPPVRTEHGWLTLFHGVSGHIVEGVDLQPDVHYAAGAMLLSTQDPSQVVYRSTTPVLEPLTACEQTGMVNNVVFPTGVDVREGGRIDVYYGMADARIGVGKLFVPSRLDVRQPETAAASA